MIDDVKDVHFESRTECSEKAIIVRLRGNADMQVHGDIDRVLRAVDAESKRLAVTEAVVDVTELYFMNSTCLSLLVRWISGLSPSEGYKIRFLSNPNLRWQKRSLQALRAMGPEVVTID